jgi:hypothetical protein
LSTKVADHLPKSAIVTVTGHLYLNEYKGKDSNQYASIACHADRIQILAKSTGKPAAAGTPEPKPDLPF